MEQSQRKRTKRIYKKRAYKAPVYRAPRTIYDGAVACKIHDTRDMVATVGSNPYMTVNWAGNSIAAGTGTTARVTVLAEFTAYSAIYSHYKVVGCKIKIIPVTNQTYANSSMNSIAVGTSTLNLPGSTTTNAEFLSFTDYSSNTFNKPFVKWCNAGAFFPKNAVANTPMIDWLSTGINYPDIGTLIYISGTGFPLNAIMAKCEIVWYVKFKGPHN